MTNRKIIVITVVIAIIIVFIGAVFAFDINLFQKKKEDVADDYFNKTMDIKEVTSGDLVNSIASKGTITTQSTLDIKALVNLKIEDVNVLSGSRVQEGDVIVTLDKESLQDEYDTLQKKITLQKKQLGDMKPRYDYINIVVTQSGKVIESNVVRGKTVDELLEKNENILAIETSDGGIIFGDNLPNGKVYRVYKSAYKNSKVKVGDVLFIIKVLNGDFGDKVQEIEQLENQLEVVKQLIANPVIKAQVAGIVGDVTAKDDAQCEKDDILLELKRTDAFLIKLSITKEELAKVDETKAAVITLNSGAKAAGEIYHVSYEANDNGKFDILIKLANLDNVDPYDILPGLNASVKIILEEKSNVLKVPIDSIKTDDNGEYILVYTGAKEDFSSYNLDTVPTEKRYIEKGMITAMYTEIISGVVQGENVIIVTTSKNDSLPFGSPMIGF